MDEAKYKSMVLLIVILAHAGMSMLVLLGAVAPKQEQETPTEVRNRLVQYILCGWLIGIFAISALHELLTK